MKHFFTSRIRWQVPVVLLITVLVAYLDRLNISLALPLIADEFGWSVEETGKLGGLLISIFFVGYGLTNMFLSPLGERFGPRKGLLAIIVLFSLFTALTAPAASIIFLFVAVRFLLGVGEGIHFPMNNYLIKNWFPTGERSRANGIWISGIMFSTIIAPLLLVPIIETFGWRMMFVFLGVLGVVISIPLVYLFIYDTPGTHPRVSAAEAAFIESGMEKEPRTEEGFWQQIKPFARDKRYWIMMFSGILNNLAAFGLIMWFPIYFTHERGVEFSDLKYAVSIPYILAIVGIVAIAWLSDRVKRRVVIAGIGYLITGVLAYFAATAPTIPLTVGLFAAAIFFQMSYTVNEFPILQRILPKKRVATGTGFYNGMAMLIGGGLGPVIVGNVVAATGNYTSGILTLVAFALLNCVTMLVLSRFLKY
jgi:sugar phosphate permease